MNPSLIIYALLTLLLAACSSEDYESVRIGNSEEDESVRIGNQVWMAHNLNRDIGGSFCYDNDSLNCEKYGRLYTWKAAQYACPEGWRLPTHADFRELEKNAMDVDSGNVASVLKSSEWEPSARRTALTPSRLAMDSIRSDLISMLKKKRWILFLYQEHPCSGVLRGVIPLLNCGT